MHSGTYRETVSPASSGREAAPIRFEVAPGECATVSGADLVTVPFRKESGNVWVASVSDPVEQLFSRGEMIWEGQWPNRTRGQLFEVPQAVAAQGTGIQGTGDASVSTIVDPNIPDGDWTGAMVYIIPGSRWQSDSRPVRAYDRANHTLTLDTTVPWAEASIRPIPTNPYYLYNSKLALDVQDEWLWQDGRLYYYSLDDPGRHALEYKRRSFAFDVAGSYVEISGFRVFGAAVRLSGHHNTVDSITSEYSSHLRTFNAYYTVGDVNLVAGDDNVWKNSSIAKSGSAGLIIRGDRNLIVNNVVTDVTYQATNHAGIEIPDCFNPQRENLILFNTVSRSGRSGIYLYGAQESRVLKDLKLRQNMLAKALEQPITDKDRAAARMELDKLQKDWEAARARYRDCLEKAKKPFEDVENTLAKREEDDKLGGAEKLSDGDRELLRDARFGSAEAYFYLEEYPEAVRRYQLLRLRYEGQFEELVILSQLWQCYALYLNETEKAKALVTSVSESLKKLPDSAFNGSSAFHKRDYWEAWVKQASAYLTKPDKQ